MSPSTGLMHLNACARLWCIIYSNSWFEKAHVGSKLRFSTHSRLFANACVCPCYIRGSYRGSEISIVSLCSLSSLTSIVPPCLSTRIFDMARSGTWQAIWVQAKG